MIENHDKEDGIKEDARTQHGYRGVHVVLASTVVGLTHALDEHQVRTDV